MDNATGLSGPVLAALLFAIGLVLVKSYDKSKFDPREPPVISPKIPYVGHVVGMLARGSKYFKSLGERHPHPIFTLPTLNSRLYIVTNPNLAAAVQRASKALSFNPIIPPVTQAVLGFDDATIRLMKSDMEHGFVQEIQEMVHSMLSPGDGLDALTQTAGDEFLKCLDKYRSELQSTAAGRNEDFLKWIKQVVTTATANFLYGHENPLEQNPKLASQFWDFDSGIPKLLVGLVPSIIAKKAFRGRETLVTALDEFRQSESYKKASKLTRDRNAIAFEHGVTANNVARSDLSFLFAGIVNTSLASFWLTLNVFSSPALLKNIRQEIEETLQGNGKKIFSIKRIVKDCPLLVSSFREILRLYSDNFSTRMVLEDTLLADTYFLRKGSIVQISGGIMHAQESIWGDNVDDFDAERFVPKKKGEKSKQIHPAAFRAFGGGSTLCPGRHFALNEIVGFAAMVILLFDVTEPEGQGVQVPKKQDGVVPIHVLEPASPASVKIKAREEWDEVELVIEA